MADNYELALRRIKQRYEQKGLSQQEANAQASKDVSQAQQNNDLNWWEKTMGAGVDFMTDVQTGVAKGIEGLIDAGASLVAGIGSWFGADTSGIENFIKTDYTDKFMNSDPMKFINGMNSVMVTGNFSALPDVMTYNEKIEQGNYINEADSFWQNAIHGVGQSIGQMLPTLATANIAGGLGASDKLVQGINLAQFGTQAMGNTVEQSLNEGNELGASIGYGVLSGIKEALTEKINLELFGSKIGGVIGKPSSKITEKSLKTFLGDMLKQGFFEGMEEVEGDLLDPLIRSWTIDKDLDLGKEYSNIFSNTFGDDGLFQSFVSGAISGMVMGGVSEAPKYLSVDARNISYAEEASEAVGKLTKAVMAIESDTSLTPSEKERMAKPYMDKIAELKNRYKELTKSYIETNKNNETNKDVIEALELVEQRLDSIKTLDDASFDNVKNNIRDKYGMNVYKDTSENLEKMIEEQGLEKIPELAKKDIEGWTDGKGNIYIAEDSKAFKQGVINKYQTIAHEIGHNLSANQKSKLHSTVLDNISKKNDKLFDRAVNGKQVAINKDNWLENYKKIYANEIKGMDSERARAYVTEEFVNDYISQKSTNAKELNELIKADKTNFIKRMFSKKANRDKIIRNIIEKGLKQSAKANAKYELLALARNIGASQEEIDELRKDLEPVLASKKNEVKKSKENSVNKTESNKVEYDSEGRKLSKETAERFKNSLVREGYKKNGRLLEVYHGTRHGGFTIFNPSLDEFDYGHYIYGDNVVNFFASVKEGSATYSGSENEIISKEQSNKGNGIYKVYLNIEKPLIIDAKGSNWNKIQAEEINKETLNVLNHLDNISKEFGNDDVFLDEDDVYKFLLALNNKDFEFNDEYGAFVTGYYKDRKFLKMGLFPMKISHIKFTIITQLATNYMPENFGKNNPFKMVYKSTNDFVQQAIDEGKYDGVIIKNVVDSGAMGDYYEPMDIYITIKSSDQIKSVYNQKPTDNPDIYKSKSNAITEQLDIEQISDRIQLYDAEQKKLVIDFINYVYKKNNSVRVADLYGNGLDTYLTDQMFKEFGGQIENGERVGEINEEDVISWLKQVSDYIIEETNDGIIYISDSAIESPSDEVVEQPKKEPKPSKLEQVKLDKFSKDVIDQINTTDEAISKIEEIQSALFNENSLDNLVKVQGMLNAKLNKDSIDKFMQMLVDNGNKTLEVLEARRLLRNKFIKTDEKFRKRFMALGLEDNFYKEVFKPYTKMIVDFATEYQSGNKAKFDDLVKINAMQKEYNLLTKQYQSIPGVDSDKLNDMFNYPLKYTYKEVFDALQEHKEYLEGKTDTTREERNNYHKRLDSVQALYPNIIVNEYKQLKDEYDYLVDKIDNLKHTDEKYNDRLRQINESFERLGKYFENAQEEFDKKIKEKAKAENTTAVQVRDYKGELSTVVVENNTTQKTLENIFNDIHGTDNESQSQINKAFGVNADKALENVLSQIDDLDEMIDNAEKNSETIFKLQDKLKSLKKELADIKKTADNQTAIDLVKDKIKATEDKIKAEKDKQAEIKKAQAEKEKLEKQAKIERENLIKAQVTVYNNLVKKFKDNVEKLSNVIEKMRNATTTRAVEGYDNRKGFYKQAKELLDKLTKTYTILTSSNEAVENAVNYEIDEEGNMYHDDRIDIIVNEFDEYFTSLNRNFAEEVETVHNDVLDRIQNKKKSKSAKVYEDVSSGILLLDSPLVETQSNNPDEVIIDAEIVDNNEPTQTEVNENETKPKKESKPKAKKKTVVEVKKTIESMRKIVKKDSAKLVDEWTNARKDKVYKLKVVDEALQVIEQTLNAKNKMFRFLFVSGINGENGRELALDTIHKIANGYGVYKDLNLEKKKAVITQLLLDNAEHLFYNNNADITYQKVKDIPSSFTIRGEIENTIRDTVDIMLDEKYDVTESAKRLEKLTESYRKALDKMNKDYAKLLDNYDKLSEELDDLKEDIKLSKNKVDKDKLEKIVDKIVKEKLKVSKDLFNEKAKDKISNLKETIKILKREVRSVTTANEKNVNKNITLLTDLYGENKISPFKTKLQTALKEINPDFKVSDELYTKIALALSQNNINEASSLLLDSLTVYTEVDKIDLDTNEAVRDKDGNVVKEVIEINFSDFIGTNEYDELDSIVMQMFDEIINNSTKSYKAKMTAKINDLRDKIIETGRIHSMVDSIRNTSESIKSYSQKKGKGLSPKIADSVQILAKSFSKISRRKILNGTFRRQVRSFFKNYTYKGVQNVSLENINNEFILKNYEGNILTTIKSISYDDKGKITGVKLDNGYTASVNGNKVIVSKDGITKAILEGAIVTKSREKNGEFTKNNGKFVYNLQGFEVTYDNQGDSIMNELDYPLPTELMEKIESIYNKEGKIDLDEVKTYKDILSGIRVYIKNAGGAKVVHIGELSGTTRELVLNEIHFQHEFNKEHKHRKIWTRLIKFITDARVFFEHLSGYSNRGLFHNFYNEFQKAQSNYETNFVDLVTPILEFKKQNSNFYDSIHKKVTIGNFTGTNGKFLSLYKLIKQEHSLGHIVNDLGGFGIEGVDVNLNNEGVNKLLVEIENHFDLNNKDSVASKYINNIVTPLLKKTALLKKETDIKLRGFTNILDENYFPIRISASEFNKDLTMMNYNDLFLGSNNYSFNNSRVSTNGRIEVLDIDDILELHIKQICTYNAYSNVINDLNYIYNMRLSSEDGVRSGLTLHKQLLDIYGKTDKGGIVDNFLNKLVTEIQGVTTRSSQIEQFNIVERTRGRYARAKLGLNLKVALSQLASIPTALKYVNVFRPAVKGVPEIPAIAKYRALDKTAIKSYTLSEKSGKFLDKFTALIGFNDRLAINYLWKCCVAQCKAQYSEVGSEAYKKAEALFTKVVRETQPNYSILDRSELLRSKNTFIRMLTQFTTVANKNLSNFVEGIDRIMVGKGSENNTKHIARIGGALAMTFVTYTALTELFKWLLDKDDDKDDLLDYFASPDLISDFINNNLISMIPLFNQLQINFEGFFNDEKWLESNDFGLGFLDIFNDIQDLMTSFGNGDISKKTMVNNFSKVLEIFGIPVTNTINYFGNLPANMLARAGSTTYKEKIDSLTGKTYNKSDIIKTKNENLSKAKFKTFVNGRLELDDETEDFVFDIYRNSNGDMDIKQVPTTLTTATGEQITVNQLKFRASFSNVSKVLRSLKSSTRFSKLDSNKKLWVINKLFNTYYEMSKKLQTMASMTALEILSSSKYNLATLMTYLADIQYITDTDENTRKENIEAYIKKLRLSTEEKQVLFKLAGYKIPTEYHKQVTSFLRRKGLKTSQIKNFLS